MSERSVKATAFLLFLIALAIRIFFILRNQFDGLYGQDSYAYYDYALALSSSVMHGTVLPPFFWPIGFPALVALATLIVGPSPVAGQAVSLVTGSLVAPLGFLITRQVATEGASASNSRSVGIRDVASFTTGLILATGGQLVQSSVVVMSDAAALFWTTFSAYVLLRYLQGYRERWLMLAAIALSMAIVTRWVYAGLIPVWGLVLLFEHVRGRAIRLPIRPLATACLMGVVVLSPQLVLSSTDPAPVLGHSWLVGWNPLNALSQTIDNVDGHFAYALPVGVFYAQTGFHPGYISPVLTILLLAGAYAVARQANRFPTGAVLLLGWVVIEYGFVAGIPYENFRFGLAYLLPLAVLVGVGAQSLYLFLGSHGIPSKAVSRTLALVLVAGLGWNLFWTGHPLEIILDIKRGELRIIDLLHDRVASGATIVAFGPTLSIQHYTSLRAVDLSEQTPDALRSLAGESNRLYLIVDISNLETQWRGRSPSLNFEFLVTHFESHRLDQVGNYTLFALDTR